MNALFTKHLLSLVIFVPLVGALILLLFKSPPDEANPHHDGHSKAKLLP